uniref:Piwi domain-containing protein n=1 Tax=Ditylenchus dipsaci TaxID=166011 RepID=A0A915DTB7_9BILA
MGAQQEDVPAMLNLADCYFGARGTGSVFASDEDMQQGMQLNQSPKAIDDLRLQSVFPLIPPEADLLNYQEHFAVVSERAKRGSVTATRVLKIWEHMQSAMTAFKNNDHAKLVAELSAAIHLDQQIHPDELEVNTCYVHLNTRGDRKGRLVIHSSGGGHYNSQNSRQLRKSPKTVELLLELHERLADTVYYLKGTIYARMDKPSKTEREEMNKSFDAFLSVAAKDHPKVLVLITARQKYHIGNENTQQFVACYEAGLAAEDHQLPCFLPINFDLNTA